MEQILRGGGQKTKSEKKRENSNLRRKKKMGAESLKVEEKKTMSSGS